MKTSVKRIPNGELNTRAEAIETTILMLQSLKLDIPYSLIEAMDEAHSEQVERGIE